MKDWIATVIKCGPLLGLFGTVLGMMAAFGRIGTGEKVQPSQIADEISIALICTAMGLGTAVLQWVGCSADEYHAAVEAALTD